VAAPLGAVFYEMNEMTTLFLIVLATLMAGVGSVWLAAWLSFGVLSRFTQHMLSLAAGALLATAFMNLLPEAFESGVEPHQLFLTLLAGLVFFFLLDKAELWHHGHEHHHEEEHSHGHHHHANDAQTGGWSLLAGDSLHCFGDGILIASAFMADWHLGVVSALAVLVHEIPHHMGDLSVIARGKVSSRAAVIKVSIAGTLTALGGLVGYVLVDALHEHLPYFLVVASSSFVYVALADLIPQLQKRLSLQQTLAQVLWLALGMGAVWVVGMSVGGHAH
jgi:zinc and cadmium transporter